MFEHKRQAPISRRAFVARLARHGVVALGILAVSLFGGMLGFRETEGLSWLDSFLNASMLLGGMGPVNTPRTVGGKLFAGCYALYAGLFFLILAGFLLAPVFHRVLHRFHWEEEGEEKPGSKHGRRD